MPGDGLDRLEFPRLREILSGLASSYEGQRRLDALTPFADLDDAEETLFLVAALRQRHDEGRGLPPFEVGDLRAVFSRLRAEGGVLTGEEFLLLAPLLAAVRTAKNVLGAAREACRDLAALGDPLTPYPHLERALEATFDPGGEIKDSASSDLRRIRRDRETRREHLRARMERLAAKIVDQDAATLVTLREGRYVLAVPQSHKARTPGIVQDRSASGQTFFIEPMEIVEANNGLRELDAEERAEIRRILADLTKRFFLERETLETDADRIAELDTLRARALLALRWGGERPALTGDRRLRLKGARHPLLLEARRTGGDLAAARTSVVPLEVSLDETTRVLLLTGPNMGGKTVALKAVGLLCAMAQSGCLIPADPECELPWVDRWVVSFGDEQSLAADLSTFGAHLQRWGEALREAGPRTFVLLDELGSGTDPAEGAALAQSVLERLLEKHAMGLVTTHLGSLKGFAASAEGIKNASMVFDPDTRRPTYRLIVGVPGKSHALEMARRLGFPEERVARAEALLPQEERDVSRLLDELADERRKLAAAREEAERAERSARTLERERKEGLERLLEERGALRAKAARQAREILRRAEESVRRTEEQVRLKGRLTETERRELAREHAREQAELARLEAPRKAAVPHGSVPDRVREGERYWAEALGREVEIARAPDAAGRVLVVQGGLKVELPLESLRIVRAGTAPDEPKTVRSGGVTVPEVERPPVEVDLRGMRVDEAIEKLDRALDQALLAGLKEVRVIHGKGTGALRDAVREFCRAHAAVASARMADQWDGGTGATLVQLEG